MTGKLIALGECMMELIPQGDSSFSKGYAGDTFNALVYARRLNPELSISLLTAVGEDQVSDDMLEYWASFGVSLDQVIRTNKATIGIYLIATDEQGERSFSYWRAGSAASQIMNLASIEQMAERANNADVVFFSGIGLAILAEQDKAKLISLVAQLKAQGSLIAFDPNYRAKMWQNSEHAIQWLEKAYAVSDILMPGLEEHQQLFGHENAQEIFDYCQQFNAKEIVIKTGDEGVYGYYQGACLHHQPFEPAPKQVDSTAAGDSFAGTYLSARIKGDSVEKAIKQACYVAGQVVQHKGAILSQSVYTNDVKSGLAKL